MTDIQITLSEPTTTRRVELDIGSDMNWLDSKTD